MKKLFCLLFFSLIGLFNYSQNGFYTSTTKVEYNIGNQTVQFSTKIESKDLEKGLGLFENDPNFTNAVKNHIFSNVKVGINGVAKALNFDGVNKGGEVFWVYYSIPNISSVNTINITNTILMNIFANQQNIINFNINGAKGTLTCKKGSESGAKEF